MNTTIISNNFYLEIQLSTDEYNPYCSKWGYCISYDLYGSDGPGQSKGAVEDGQRGQCRDDSDCTPWRPVCSSLGYCSSGPSGQAASLGAALDNTAGKTGGTQSDWVKQNAKSGAARDEEYYGQIEDDNRKAHVESRVDDPRNDLQELLPRVESIEKTVYEPCTYCKYDPETGSSVPTLPETEGGNDLQNIGYSRPIQEENTLQYVGVGQENSATQGNQGHQAIPTEAPIVDVGQSFVQAPLVEENTLQYVGFGQEQLPGQGNQEHQVKHVEAPIVGGGQDLDQNTLAGINTLQYIVEQEISASQGIQEHQSVPAETSIVDSGQYLAQQPLVEANTLHDVVVGQEISSTQGNQESPVQPAETSIINGNSILDRGQYNLVQNPLAGARFVPFQFPYHQYQFQYQFPQYQLPYHQIFPNYFWG